MQLHLTKSLSNKLKQRSHALPIDQTSACFKTNESRFTKKQMRDDIKK